MTKEREEEIKRIWKEATKNAKIITRPDRIFSPREEIARTHRYWDLIEERMKRPENQKYYFGRDDQAV